MRRALSTLSVAALLLAAPAASERAVAQEPSVRRLAVRAGTLLTGDGGQRNDVIVLCENGQITAIGKDLKIPAGAEVIDAREDVVMPGLVDIGRAPGLNGADEVTSEITPSADALDVFDAESPALRRLALQGTTSVLIAPGRRNVVGGLAAVVKTVPYRGRAQVVARRVGLAVTLGAGPERGNYPPRRRRPGLYGRRPTTRMGTAWLLTDTFDRAAQFGGAIAEADAGRLPVLAAAHREADLRTLLALAKKHGLTTIVEGGGEAHRLVGTIAKSGVAVVLAAMIDARTARRTSEGGEFRLDTAAQLHAAKVPLALSARGGPTGLSQRDAAIMAVRGGLPASAAIAAVTSVPATLLGVADRVGTLAAGRDADFCICSGDPLALTTRVRVVIVNGRVVAGGR